MCQNKTRLLLLIIFVFSFSFYKGQIGGKYKRKYNLLSSSTIVISQDGTYERVFKKTFFQKKINRGHWKIIEIDSLTETTSIELNNSIEELKISPNFINHKSVIQNKISVVSLCSFPDSLSTIIVLVNDSIVNHLEELRFDFETTEYNVKIMIDDVLLLDIPWDKNYNTLLAEISYKDELFFDFCYNKELRIEKGKCKFRFKNYIWCDRKNQRYISGSF